MTITSVRPGPDVVEPGTVIVRGNAVGFAQTITAGSHQLTACETTEGRLDHIERTLELIGVLNDEQRARLLDIANKCPVHRTIMSEIHVETRLVPSGSTHQGRT